MPTKNAHISLQFSLFKFNLSRPISLPRSVKLNLLIIIYAISTTQPFFSPPEIKKIPLIAGAVSLSSISEMISKLIGADDAVKSGSEISGTVAGTVAKMGGMAVGLGKAAIAKGVGVAKGIKNRNAEKREITDKPKDDISGIAETTGNIANTVDSNQAIGNNASDGSNPPSGGGDGGGTGGGSTPPAGGGSPNTGKAVGGGSSNGMVSGGTSKADKKLEKAYNRSFSGAMKNFGYAAKTGNQAGMVMSGLTAGVTATKNIGKGILKTGGKLLKGMAGLTMQYMLGKDYKDVMGNFKSGASNDDYDKIIEERNKKKAKFKENVKTYAHQRWRAGVKAKYDAKVERQASAANRKKRR